MVRLLSSDESMTKHSLASHCVSSSKSGSVSDNNAADVSELASAVEEEKLAKCGRGVGRGSNQASAAEEEEEKEKQAKYGQGVSGESDQASVVEEGGMAPPQMRPQTVVYVAGIGRETFLDDASDHEQPSTSGEPLLEAELVTTDRNMVEQVLQRMLSIATPAENVRIADDPGEATRNLARKQRGRMTCIGALLIILLGALALITVLFLTRGYGEDGTPAPTTPLTPISNISLPTSTSAPPSSAPTSAFSFSADSPTMQPTTAAQLNREMELKELLLPALNVSHLDELQSAQHKAFWWLLIEDSFIIEERSQLIERFVLLVLYFSTDGPNWTRQYSFLAADVHHCAWVALEEDVLSCSDNETTEIKLRENNLVGSVPGELQYMPNLKRLYFQDNELQGTIPSELGSLPRLVKLKLGNNSLRGTIPSTLFGSKDLRMIELEHNSISGTIPESVGESVGLEALDISENQLTGTLPLSLANLTLLEELRLDGNVRLEGPIPDFSENRNLLAVSLGNNRLKGTIPRALFENRKLTALSIYTNCLEGTLPSEMKQLTELRFLNFMLNQLTGSLPVLPTAPNLTRLGMGHNNLTGNLGSLLGGEFPKLDWFRADVNKFTGSLPDTIGKQSMLTHLDISRNPLSGTVPTELGLLTLMTKLDLYENQLDGTIPTELGLLTGLESLRISGNNLGGAIPSEIGRLTELTYLNVCCNSLNGTIPTELSNLSELTELNMEENELTGPVLESWNRANFPDLESFSLHTNNLVGNLNEGFCVHHAFEILIEADCLGGVDPEVECSCCECW